MHPLVDALAGSRCCPHDESMVCTALLLVQHSARQGGADRWSNTAVTVAVLILPCCCAVLGEGAAAFKTQQLLLRNKFVRSGTALRVLQLCRAVLQRAIQGWR
jgi:hypothetical protein